MSRDDVGYLGRRGASENGVDEGVEEAMTAAREPVQQLINELTAARQEQRQRRLAVVFEGNARE